MKRTSCFCCLPESNHPIRHSSAAWGCLLLLPRVTVSMGSFLGSFTESDSSSGSQAVFSQQGATTEEMGSLF
jgi:hypothetical protein